MKIRNLLKLDPLKSFTELPAFKFSIILSLLFSTMSALLIIFNSDIDWRIDYLGLNTFVEIFRVPLSILAIAITIVAILATMHRSAQTKEQILNANKQNVFSNYYKHIEEFEKHMNSTIKNKKLIFENLRLAHKFLFPNADKGNYNVSKIYLEIIEKEFARIMGLLNYFNEDRKETVHNLLLGIYAEMDKCFSYLFIRIGRSGIRQFEDGKLIIVPSNNIIEIVNDIRNTSLILINILSFDSEVIIPHSLEQVSNLIISQVPKWSFDSKQKFENFILFKEL